MPDQILTVNLSLTIFLNSLGNFHSNLNNKWNNNGGKFQWYARCVFCYSSIKSVLKCYRNSSVTHKLLMLCWIWHSSCFLLKYVSCLCAIHFALNKYVLIIIFLICASSYSRCWLAVTLESGVGGGGRYALPFVPALLIAWHYMMVQFSNSLWFQFIEHWSLFLQVFPAKPISDFCFVLFFVFVISFGSVCLFVIYT